MKCEGILKPTNDRIRSFLSPGISLSPSSNSGSKSKSNMNTSFLDNKKTYIDFRRMNKLAPENKSKMVINLEQYRKDPKKDTKKEQRLAKCSVKNKNREAWRNSLSSEIDLIGLVHDLKKKVVHLERQNYMLKQRQQPQNQSAAPIEPTVLSPRKARPSNSVSVWQSKSRLQKAIQSRINTVESIKMQIEDWWDDKQNKENKERQKEGDKQNQKYKKSNGEEDPDATYSKEGRELERMLLEIERHRRKELSQIDRLLFRNGF